jgi:hypothetical protein
MERDLVHVPWMVGRYAVILKPYDEKLSASEIVFDSMEIWVRILNLPLGWMNQPRGSRAMNLIGQVVKMDVDADGKASGAFLRARVAIEIAKLLHRGVLLRMNKIEEPRWFDMQYERLPFYCFTCGILGHSEVDCPHPVAQNEAGKLPYDVPLRAPKERRRRLPSFAEAAADTFGSGSSSRARLSWTGADRTRDSRASGGDGASHHSSSDPVEVQSPLKESGTDPKAKGTAEGETNR